MKIKKTLVPFLVLLITLSTSACSESGGIAAFTVCRDSGALAGMSPADYPDSWLDFFRNNRPNDTQLNNLQNAAIDAIENYKSNPTTSNYSAALNSVADWNYRCVDIAQN